MFQLKKVVLSCLIILAVSSYVYAESEHFTQLGKHALLNKDILGANEHFSKAVAIHPDDAEANFYYAFTRLLVLPQINDEIFNLFKDMGFTGPNGSSLNKSDLDPFNFMAKLPAGIKTFELVSTFPDGGRLRDGIKNIVLAEIDSSLANLDLVLQTAGFNSYLRIENTFMGADVIEIDHSDALMFKALISLFKAKMLEMLIYNIDADLANLSYLYTHQGIFAVRYALEQYPDLMRAQGEDPQALQNALISAANSYIESYNSITAETDGQLNDLFSIAPAYQEEAEFFAGQISDIKKSLESKPDFEFSFELSQIINLGYMVINPFDFRRLLDQDGLEYLLNTHVLENSNYTLSTFSKAPKYYQEFLPPQNPFYNGKPKEADFADISAIKSGLKSIQTFIYSMLGYNLKIGNSQDILLEVLEGNQFKINSILSYNYDFLTLTDTNNIDLARETFNHAVSMAITTVDYLRDNEDSQQFNDVLVPSLYFWANEGRYKQILLGINELQQTFVDPQLEIRGDEFRLNLGEFFANYKNARALMPLFDYENNPGPYDKTFGGIYIPYE